MDEANGGLWEGETQSSGVEDELREESELLLHCANIVKEEEEKFPVQGHVALDRCNWGLEACIHTRFKSMMSI